MSWVAVAVAGAALVGGVMASDAQGDAAETAANAQTASAQAGISEQRSQFEAIQKLLQPYVESGNRSLAAQGDLTGLNGPNAQQAAIDAIKKSPAFTSMLAQGENSILQNASATGGLRGGNTQAALAQFSPALLAASINDQYGRLGGMTSIGQNAAAGTGNAGMATGAGVSSLLQQQGAAQAGAALAGGRADAGMYNSVGQSFGLFGAMGGFGRMQQPSATQAAAGTGSYGWYNGATP